MSMLTCRIDICLFFFFQAEDGIRDLTVTGVQTCALPIFDKTVNAKLADLSLREITVLVPLLACIVWIGVYPKPILRRMEPSARQLIQSVRLNAASFTAVRGAPTSRTRATCCGPCCPRCGSRPMDR